MDKNIHLSWESNDGLPIKCIMDASRNVKHLLDKKMKINGLTSVHIRILAYIYICQQSEKLVYQKDIEEVFRMSKSTVSGVLQHLEIKGYMIRKCDESDSRYKRITLTEDGVKVHTEAMKKLNELENRVRSALSDDEFKLMIEFMRRLDNRITEIYEED